MASINLSWNASPTATAYTVYRSTTAGVRGAPIGVPQPGTTAVDTQFSAGVTYYYSVTASNSVGEGPASAQVQFDTPTVPVAPTGLTATYVP